MELQQRFALPLGNEPRQLSVGVAGQVRELPELLGLFVQPVNRQQREELLNRPAVGGGAKDRQVGVERRGQCGLEVAQFLGDRLIARQFLGDGLGAGPGELFGYGAFRKAEVAQAEGVQRVVFEFERVVPGLLQLREIAIALPIDGINFREGLAQVADRERFLALGGWAATGHGALAEHVEHQH